MVSCWLGNKKAKYQTGNGTSINIDQVSKEYHQLFQENERIKNLLGDKDLEIAILRDLIKRKPSLADKIEIAQKWISRGYPKAKVLQIIGIHRTTYYYRYN